MSKSTIINKHNFLNVLKSQISGPPVRKRKIRHLINSSKFCSVDGVVMEFGVGHGHSVNYISKIFEDQIVYGFDSFEGLPEPWNGPDTYEYNVPAIDINSLKLNSNIEIRQGFFKDSIPIWIAEINPEKIKFMHIDSNLYSSAITTLSLLDKFIVPGTVICLDEFFFWDEPHKWPLWYKEEFRALKEWVTLYDRSFEILFYGNRNELSIQIN